MLQWKLLIAPKHLGRTEDSFPKIDGKLQNLGARDVEGRARVGSCCLQFVILLVFLSPTCVCHLCSGRRSLLGCILHVCYNPTLFPIC
jgi:hypothetical protein